MNDVLKVVLYIAIFFLLGLIGYKLYTVLNNKIKGATTGLQSICFSLLLFFCYALLLVGGLYLFIELYAFLSRQQP